MVRAVARVVEADRIAYVVFIHDALKGIEIFDIRPVEFQDDVAMSETCLIKGTAGSDFIDIDTGYVQLHAEASCHLLVQAV